MKLYVVKLLLYLQGVTQKFDDTSFYELQSKHRSIYHVYLYLLFRKFALILFVNINRYITTLAAVVI